MARALPEWWGKTPDSKVPPRVRQRIFDREKGRCHLSGREIAPGEDWQLDHKIGLINGGEHRETNLFPALVGPHREKTKRDVAEKAKVARIRAKHYGSASKSSNPMPGSKASGWRKPFRGPPIRRNP